MFQEGVLLHIFFMLKFYFTSQKTSLNLLTSLIVGLHGSLMSNISYQKLTDRLLMMQKLLTSPFLSTFQTKIALKLSICQALNFGTV